MNGDGKIGARKAFLSLSFLEELHLHLERRILLDRLGPFSFICCHPEAEDVDDGKSMTLTLSLSLSDLRECV